MWRACFNLSCFGVLHFIFYWCGPGNDHHWYLPHFINVIFMILQEIIRIGCVFFMFILWNFKLNSDMVRRSEIAQRGNVLQINSIQKPYLTWIKINVALCSLFISIMWKKTLLDCQELDVTKCSNPPFGKHRINTPSVRKNWGVGVHRKHFLWFIYFKAFI